MDGSVLQEKSTLKMFLFQIGLGLLHVSIAKTVSNKMVALIHSNKFPSPEVPLYLYKSTIQSCMEHCCHVWVGVDLLNKLQKQICRTVDPWLTNKI